MFSICCAVRIESETGPCRYLVEKLDQPIIDVYRQVLGCDRPKYFRVSNEDEEMNYVYLPLPKDDNYVELLAPVRGPSEELLKKKGQGTMFGLCVDVENIEVFYDEMKARGIALCDPMGRPLTAEKKWCSIPGDDNKYAYLPEDKTFGTTIEILERNTWKRETYWQDVGLQMLRIPENAPETPSTPSLLRPRDE